MAQYKTIIRTNTENQDFYCDTLEEALAHSYRIIQHSPNLKEALICRIHHFSDDEIKQAGGWLPGNPSYKLIVSFRTIF